MIKDIWYWIKKKSIRASDLWNFEFLEKKAFLFQVPLNSSFEPNSSL